MICIFGIIKPHIYRQGPVVQNMISLITI